MAEKLNSILNNYVAEGTATKDKLPGAAFVVVNKDGPIYRGSAGRTRLSSDSPHFTPSSITWIASMTKLLTATTIMHLVEHRPDLVTLDTDLRPLVPELANLQIITGFKAPESDGGEGEPILVPNTRPITLRHLLTHTSGFGVDIADPDLIRWSKYVGRKADQNSLSCTLEGWTTPLKFAPGDGWYYGSGPDWAGLVLERLTGKRLGEYMEEFLFRPLGVRDTGFFVNRLLPEGGKDREERYVPVAERDAESGEWREGTVPFPAEPPCESGGGGLYSSAVDYGKVMQMLLGALAGEESGVVGGELVREMFSPQLVEKQRDWLRAIIWAYGSGAELPQGSPVDFGIGGLLNTADVEGKRRKGSVMWSGAGNARWWIDPETGIGAALFVNAAPYGDPTVLKMYDELERTVYGELLPAWQASK
ncbi:beta-lactamase/transpeptidase-like protein [Parathielavia appendiculata]|uniref:Beta-lactamase/transpeptidase-like protein n=1 Tax=Parathielavia appendiculata TaxID=2587402 RepID=A0AAN6TVD8_9PEZI|nr:beta-lactamase/transpeptidase-like protein [Parathielavia appendiculata]